MFLLLFRVSRLKAKSFPSHSLYYCLYLFKHFWVVFSFSCYRDIVDGIPKFELVHSLRVNFKVLKVFNVKRRNAKDINMHNKEVIAEKKTEAVKCNCINKPNCPLSNQCQITDIIYKAKITSNLRKYHQKIYYRSSEGTFKQRYGNHKKSFNHEKYRTDTGLSKEYWRFK